MNAVNPNFVIKDCGEIIFAENDRCSKYVRIPFTPVIDDSKATTFSLFRKSDSSEFLGKIDSNDQLSPVDQTEIDKQQKSFAECVADLLRYGWKLPSPQLVISVTGGAHLFKLPTPRARYAFQRGLIAAAVTTDAWIITAGTYAGVMKEVGDAVDKRRYKNTKTPSKVQCIGIGSWNYTTDHEYLIQQHPSSFETSFDLRHSISFVPMLKRISSITRQDDDYTSERVTSVLAHIPQNIQKEQTKKLYRIRIPKSDEKSCSLDPNHTHFILLDDMLDENIESASSEITKSVNCRADHTIKPRIEIEHAISKSYHIPIVQILANGGASSVLTVCQALQKGTPVIVIEGTGRAADEIAREYRYLYGNHSTKHGEQHSISVYEKASSKFEDFEKRMRSPSGGNTALNDTNRDQFIQQLTSREGYFLISIFQFHNEHGEQKLDDAILHALFNAAKIQNEGKQRTIELKLAMAWNKFDRIQRNILTDKTICQWTDLELDRALRDALRMNKIRCADLLIEYGASFDRLPRLRVLDKFYEEIEANVLPYSQYMTKVIQRTEETFDCIKPSRKHFYEGYLDINLDCEKKLPLSWVDNSNTKYGTLDDDKISASDFNHPICVFNAIDMIHVNGFLNTVSIRFDNTKPFSSKQPLLCYLISPTNDLNSFLIVFKCQLQPRLNNSTDICHYRTTEKQLFVTSGQYIAIGFSDRTGFPSNIPHRHQHSVHLDHIKNICSIDTKKSIRFNVENDAGVAVSFTINPSSTYSRDLFYWSLFFKRHNMATYLCSKSSNTIIAALLASKIYHRAAEFTEKREELLDFVEKQKEFEKHASIIIDMCFDENNDFALDILTKKAPFFFDKHPLQIAKDINSRTFFATKTVQHYLDQQWYGHIDGYDRGKFWISSLIFIMCLIPILIPIPVFSQLIISDKRQDRKWEEKPHIIGWSARIFYRFKEFYYGRAIVRFYHNIIFYIFFLTLFSYVLLVEYFPININSGQRSGYNNLLIPVTEICLHILIWSLIFEEGTEFRQYWKEKKDNHSRYNIWDYFTKNKWNILDIIAIIIYLVAFITRFILIKEAFITSKILMCIDLFLWYMRLLHVFSAFERLGPKLLMIFNTMKDLVFFIYFIVVFWAAYAVTSYALIISEHQISWENDKNEPSSREFKTLNNGASLWNWMILRDIIDWSTWKIFGQIDFDTFYHFNNETRVTVANDAYGTVALILTIFFVSMANILLLNVLVALFNVTIQKVHDSAYESWAYHRFLLVTEYNQKNFLPPTLNIPIYIFYPLYEFFQFCLSKRANTTYGTHDNDKIMKIDSNLSDMVVFNGIDRVRRKGFISSVTINFSSPPRISNPVIMLYLLTSDNDKQNEFFVVGEQQLPTSHIQLAQTGVQTIVLDDPLGCDQNQFVALAFEKHSGTPDVVNDRNEHSVNHADFCSLKNNGKSIHFINYPNKGAAFSFIVERSSRVRNNRTFRSQIRRRSLERVHVGEESSDSEKFVSLNQHTLSTLEEFSSLTVTTQNNFEERDNMLREISIAEDYWKQVIDKIKQQEAKMVEEQNDSTNSSKSSANGSEQDENDIKRTEMQ